jgi:ketosteroid isomerase-like protein
MVRTFAVVACSLSVLVGSAAAEEKQVTDDQYAELQKNFAEAYNRRDAAAMAAAFAQDGIRVTPSGIFQGRDAIQRNLQDALDMGLHDYTVQRTGSRSEGTFVFNVGKWQAKLGDRPLHGYYTAIIIRDGDRARIMEETVTVAAPGQ